MLGFRKVHVAHHAVERYRERVLENDSADFDAVRAMALADLEASHELGPRSYAMKRLTGRWRLDTPQAQEGIRLWWNSESDAVFLGYAKGEAGDVLQVITVFRMPKRRRQRTRQKKNHYTRDPVHRKRA